VIARLRRSLQQLIRSERGIALPMALMITVIAMGFAAVPIVATVSSQGDNSRNQGGNEALAAAEAGAELAVLKQGELHEEFGSERTCAVGAPLTNGWCAAEPSVPYGAASYTYQVLPCYGQGVAGECGQVVEQTECDGGDPMRVVATGTALVGGQPVERRVSLSGCATAGSVPVDLSTTLTETEERQREELLTLSTEERELRELKTPGVSVETKIQELTEKAEELEEIIFKEEAEGKTSETETKSGTKTETVTKEVPPPNPFSTGSLIGINFLTMSNNAQVYNGGVATNGPVSMEGSANVCGTVRYGTTKNARNGSENAPSGCSAGRTFVQTTPVTYPPVSLPTEISTKNSNSRLSGLDPVGSSVWQRGNIAWNESKRELSVNYNELKLEGTLPYFLCKLTLAGGSSLYSGAGKSIRIFFDDPKNCPGLNGSPQLVIANGTFVGADSNHGPGFYFVGSSTAGASKIELAGGSNVSQFVIYGPKTKIIANNGVTVNGAILGESIELAGGASINKAGSFTPPPSGEYLAPEKKTETITVATSEEVRSAISIHREELRKKREELLREEHTLEEIYSSPPIVEKEESIATTSETIRTITVEIETVEKEIREWLEGGGNSAFTKSGFVECEARAPSSGVPDSGC
jgi:hypothetical protein